MKLMRSMRLIKLEELFNISILAERISGNSECRRHSGMKKLVTLGGTLINGCDVYKQKRLA